CKRNRKFQLIENTKGVYLTQLRKLNRNGQGYWMVQVFSLYDNVEIQNDFLNAGPNDAIFGNDRFVLSSEPQEGYATIENGNDEYLFSILFRVGYANAGQHSNQPVLVFFFSMLGLVLIIGGDFIRSEIQNDFLNAGPNDAIFGNDRFVLSSEPQEGYATIENGNDEYLFSILFRVGYANAGQHSNQPVLVFFFSMLGLVLIIGGDFIGTIWRKGRRIAAITYTLLIAVTIRAMMIAFHFPQSFSSIRLFDPSQYAASVLNPRLGDLFLNVICGFVVLVMILAALGRKRFLIRFLSFKRRYHEWIFIVLVYIISTALLVAFFGLFNNIVDNSQWNLNILALPDFDILIAISLIIIFLAGAGYILFTIIGLNLVLYKNPSGKAYALKVLILFFLPIGIFLSFGDLVYMIPFLAHV